LNDEGIAQFLKEINFPDINNDGVVNSQDVTSLWPSNFVVPELLKNYVLALKNGQDTLQAQKDIFMSTNIVSSVEIPNASTGELTVNLKVS